MVEAAGGGVEVSLNRVNSRLLASSLRARAAASSKEKPDVPGSTLREDFAGEAAVRLAKLDSNLRPEPEV